MVVGRGLAGTFGGLVGRMFEERFGGLEGGFVRGSEGRSEDDLE